MHLLPQRFRDVNVRQGLIALVAASMLVALWAGSPMVVEAQRDYVSCGHFATQADAQAFLDDSSRTDPTARQALDGDGDGLACEEAFVESGPVVVDPVSCGHFESQAAAQEYFEEFGLDDPGVLDWDGDGIACEEAFDDDTGTVSAPVTLPNTGTGAGITQGASVPLGAVVLMFLSAMCAISARRLVR